MTASICSSAVYARTFYCDTLIWFYVCYGIADIAKHFSVKGFYFIYKMWPNFGRRQTIATYNSVIKRLLKLQLIYWKSKRTPNMYTTTVCSISHTKTAKNLDTTFSLNVPVFKWFFKQNKFAHKNMQKKTWKLCNFR